jgi:hypothetical protein
MTPAGSLRPLRKTVPAQWAAITVAVLLLLFLLSVCLRHLAAQSHERRCYTRMMRVGQALRLYVEDYDGTWPVMDDWWQAQRDNPELADGCPAARRLPPFPHGPRFTSAIHGYAFNAVLSYKDRAIQLFDRGFTMKA